MQPITIRVVTDSSGVDAGMNQAQGKIRGGMDKMMSMTGIGYAAMGAAALTFAKQSVEAAIDAEKSQADLENAYKRFHKTLKDTTLKDLEDLATAQAKRSRFDDDAVKDAISILAQYGLTGNMLEKLTPLVVDYAAKTGMSLQDAAAKYGLFFTGSGRVMKGVGADLTSTGDLATDFATIYGASMDKVAGASEEDLGTAAGKMADLQAKWEDFQESAGAPMLVLMTDLATAMAPVIEGLTFLANKYNALQEAVAAANGPAGDFLKFLGNIVVVFQTFLDKIGQAPEMLGGLFMALTNNAAGLSTLIGWFEDAARAVQKLWDKLKGLANFGGVGNFLGNLNPFSVAPPSTAPVILSGTSATRTGASAQASSVAGLTVNVNIHGNVGDPALVGKRVTAALEAYVRTSGSRRLAQVVAP